jgi:hypothetical protein
MVFNNSLSTAKVSKSQNDSTVISVGVIQEHAARTDPQASANVIFSWDTPSIQYNIYNFAV